MWSATARLLLLPETVAAVWAASWQQGVLVVPLAQCYSVCYSDASEAATTTAASLADARVRTETNSTSNAEDAPSLPRSPPVYSLQHSVALALSQGVAAHLSLAV